MRLTTLTVLLLLISFLKIGDSVGDNGTSVDDHDQPPTNINVHLMEKQTHLITSGFSSILWSFIRHHLNQSSPHEQGLPFISSSCLSSLNLLSESLQAGQPWAFKLISASGSKPNNFLDGSYSAFGSYDSCLEIQPDHRSGHGESPGIKGQYCLTSLEPDFIAQSVADRALLESIYPHHFDAKFNLTIKIGFCIPSSCSAHDVGQLVSSALNEYSWKLTDVNQCDISTTFIDRLRAATVGQLFFFWLIVSLIGVIIWGTVMDIQSRSSDSKSSGQSSPLFWIGQFSAIKSIKGLLRKPDPSPKIQILDTYRHSAIMTVLVVHTLMWLVAINSGFAIEDVRKGINLYSHVYAQPFANDWYTELLFFIGGGSAAINLMAKMEPETPIVVYLLTILRRALLILPSLVVVMALEIILPLFGSGPFFSSIGQYRSAACMRNFLLNIFHIQNRSESLEICAPQTWSIAVEWQLFILLCIAVYIYKRNFRLGLCFNIFLVASGLYAATEITIRNEIIPHALLRTARLRDTYNRISTYYLATSSHIWSYFTSLLIVAVALSKVELGLGRHLTRWRFPACLTLLVVLSFSSIPWNIFELEINMTTTVINSLIVKLLTFIFSFLVYAPHEPTFKRFLASAKFTDFQVTLDEPIYENSTVHPEADKIMDSTHINYNNINNNSIEEGSEAHLQSIGSMAPEEYKKHHLYEVLLRLSKATYFSHSIVFSWFLTTSRTTLPLTLYAYITQILSMVTLSFVGGFVFHLLIIGPLERILFIRSRKRVKLHSA